MIHFTECNTPDIVTLTHQSPFLRLACFLGVVLFHPIRTVLLNRRFLVSTCISPPFQLSDHSLNSKMNAFFSSLFASLSGTYVVHSSQQPIYPREQPSLLRPQIFLLPMHSLLTSNIPEPALPSEERQYAEYSRTKASGLPYFGSLPFAIFL